MLEIRRCFFESLGGNTCRTVGIEHSDPMNFKLVWLWAWGLAVLPLAGQDPDPAAILEGARLSASLTKLDQGLEGTLHRGDIKVPVTLFLKGKDIQFQFSENSQPWRVFHVRMEDSRFQLFEFVDGKQKEFPERRLMESIAGTDLTYEDLSFRFFYWPGAVLEGRESVGGQECYKLRVDKPAGVEGIYQVVYVWVHTKYGAFMRIRGHNRAGVLIKEFQVEDIMKVANDVWTLRKMQVSSHDPESGRRTSITDVTFESPKKVLPKGLR